MEREKSKYFFNTFYRFTTYVKNHRNFSAVMVVVLVLLLAFSFCLPKTLFDSPYSLVINDKQDHLLFASTAEDGQWRFPPLDTVPDKFTTCITTFEDRYFFYHPGVNLVSLFRAFYLNVKFREIRSGGSTITMQVIRLSRKNKARTIKEKFIELILATRLECSFSKQEIIAMYASHAPFGGNVVGLAAGAWRYYGRHYADLTWAEAATLAVLPNAPSLIHPGKNRELLKVKRDKLLNQLLLQEKIDSLTYRVSLLEPLPDKIFQMPQMAYHAAQYLKQNTSKPGIIKSTLDFQLQNTVSNIVNINAKRNTLNHINNAAALVLDVRSGHVLAYCGNVDTKTENSPYVDLIQAKRSSGSILKPFLYASALYDGTILPNELIADIPTRYDDYSPKNFNLKYTGAIAVSTALTKSLNIPAVRLLNKYGQERFYYNLKSLGFSSIVYSPEHYGLSLILGGAEVSLWELSAAYASMARILLRFEISGQYAKSDVHKNFLTPNYFPESGISDSPYQLSASSVWFTFKAMREVKRPVSMTGWENMSSSKDICFKTGTSFGFKDAWCIGVTPDYVVAVWVGNADGEGRPGIVGTQVAAPIMFDIFSALPKRNSFDAPLDDMEYSKICAVSGLIASDQCNNFSEQMIPSSTKHPFPCSYHKNILLEKNTFKRVYKNCYLNKEVIDTSWFILPAAQAYYYQQQHADYQPLPPLHRSCITEETESHFDIIYPQANSRIYLPSEFNNLQSQCVFQALHRNHESAIFWYIDNEFITSTDRFHEIVIQDIKSGEHKLTLTDSEGQTQQINFTVINN